MEVKKAIKKMVALGIGVTMLGATMAGALALDLKDYPKPFIKDDGTFDAMIVVGEAAETGDVLGAIDIASNLQYNAGVEVSVDNAADTEVTIIGGEKVQKGSDDLSYGDALNSVVDAFDSDNFDGLLDDGTVEDTDGDDVDFEQEIQLGDADVTFGNPDDDIYDEPLPYLDLDGATEDLLTFVVDFDDPLDLTGLNDGETIEMFGKVMTFDQTIGTTGTWTLYGSDKTIVVSQGETVTVTVDGVDYDISVLGGNSDDATAILQVGSSTKTVAEGDSRTIGGLEVYVDDVFISNIGTSQVSVNLFVGSEKWTLPEGNSSDTLQVDDEDLDGVTVTVSADTDNSDVTKIEFAVDPTEFVNEDLNEDYDWLAMGDTFEEPLFGFQVEFDSVTPEIKGAADTELELRKSSDDLILEFTTNTNDDCSIELFTNDGSDIGYYADWEVDVNSSGSRVGDISLTAGTEIRDDKRFILAEDESNDPKTKIYEVKSIDESDDEVVLKELCSGKTVTVGVGDEIEDTGAKVSWIKSDDSVFNLTSATLDYLYAMNDLKISIPDVSGSSDSSATLTMEEDVNDDYIEDTGVTSATISVTLSSDNTDDEIDITTVSSTGAMGQSTEDNDVEYSLTEYGTYMERDDDNNDYLKAWYPNRDRAYNVFVAPPDATVVRKAATGTTVKQPVRIQPGASVLDTELSSYTNKNLIIVGGPAANRAAAAVLGLDFPAYGAESTIPENAAVIKLIENGNGKYALLVAGWEADDTRRAARVVAEYDQYNLQGTEVRVTGTSMADISVETVE